MDKINKKLFKQKKIHDVKLSSLKIISTPGGDVKHGMKISDTGFDGFGEAYFSNIDSNCFYMNSDHSFYGITNIFYYIYENFYNDILNVYINKGGTKYFKINYKNLILSYENTLTNKYTINRKYRKIRRNIYHGIKLQVYPTSIYNIDVKKLIKNIKMNIDKNIDNQKYIKPASGCPDFGSEKYSFLNVINKVVIKRFELPTIGII